MIHFRRCVLCGKGVEIDLPEPPRPGEWFAHSECITSRTPHSSPTRAPSGTFTFKAGCPPPDDFPKDDFVPMCKLARDKAVRELVEGLHRELRRWDEYFLGGLSK